MAKQWANVAKTGYELRLDPCHLPQNVAFTTAKTHKPMLCSLSERGASLKTNNSDDQNGLSYLIPAQKFKGIAARAVKTQTGHMAVSLELFHENREICIPLLVSRDLDDVLLDWRLWADIYDLPMLLINEDETVSSVKERAPLKTFLSMNDAMNNAMKHMQNGKCRFRKAFRLRCRGESLGVRLVIENKVMLG